MVDLCPDPVKDENYSISCQCLDPMVRVLCRAWIRVNKGYADKTSGGRLGELTDWCGCFKRFSLFFWATGGNQRVWHEHRKEEVHGFGDSERKAVVTDLESDKGRAFLSSSLKGREFTRRQRDCGFSEQSIWGLCFSLYLFLHGIISRKGKEEKAERDRRASTVHVR